MDMSLDTKQAELEDSIPGTPTSTSSSPMREAAKPSLMAKWIHRVAEPDSALHSPSSVGSKPARKLDMAELLENNRKWASRMTEANPEFFSTLAKQQKPMVLWIGCSDSRVPANQIIDLAPGEVFVHRNVGNVVTHTDFNALSVVQYAVDVLQVQHIIVCGHYGCGAITAASGSAQHGLIDNWLRNIKDVYWEHKEQLSNLLFTHAEGPESQGAKSTMCDLLCELNVARSVKNVCATTILQNAWGRGQHLTVHGWCYRLTDGVIRDLDIHIKGIDDLDTKIFHMVENKATPEV